MNGIARVLGILLVASMTSVSSASDRVDQYKVVHGWPMPPDNDRFGEVTAVGSDSKADIFVLTRAMRQWPDSDELDRTPIAERTVLLYDGRTGALKASWGAGIFALPHGMTIDSRDHVWVADVALQVDDDRQRDEGG